MTTKKLLHRIKRMLEQPREKTKRKKLCKTIQALRQKQRDLEKKLAETDDAHARERLAQKIKVVRKQRSKGVALHRQMKK
jgi:hypothetical protein